MISLGLHSWLVQGWLSQVAEALEEPRTSIAHGNFFPVLFFREEESSLMCHSARVCECGDKSCGLTGYVTLSQSLLLSCCQSYQK